MAQAVLACDVGNTRIALACVTDEKATLVRRIVPGEVRSLAEALAEVWEQMPAGKVIAASSVHPSHLEALELAAEERLGQKVLVVGREIPRPMPTDVEEPGKVGTDRLCSAAMAYYRLEGACAVAQIGTAITVDCVGDDGVFLGGAILPGVRLQAEALASRTAQLPAVALRRPDWVYGKNTEQAIIGGIVYGVRGALRELVEAYATDLGKWPPLVVTGGDADLVAGGSDLVQAVVPDLCLLGVGLAYDIFRASQAP